MAFLLFSYTTEDEMSKQVSFLYVLLIEIGVCFLSVLFTLLTKEVSKRVFLLYEFA